VHLENAVREEFELSCENSEQSDSQAVKKSQKSVHTQIRAQIPDALVRDLSLVVASWSKLSPPIEEAILRSCSAARSSMPSETQKSLHPEGEPSMFSLSSPLLNIDNTVYALAIIHKELNLPGTLHRTLQLLSGHLFEKMAPHHPVS
jgi:hypothetical protein